jgi:2-isopropylmalate synthase
VYTSFSGSHQDAIKKAFAARREGDPWNMPYLPIDPKDLGRSYDAVIRVNSQSGKGGISYLLENEYGLELPRRLQIEFSAAVQAVMDVDGRELTASDIWGIFEREYGLLAPPQIDHRSSTDPADGRLRLSATVRGAQQQIELAGQGNGPVDAFVAALSQASGVAVRVLDYHEHAIGSGAQARAAAYLELRIGDERTLFGVGIDANIVTASMQAVLSGLQRAGVALAAESAPA